MSEIRDHISMFMFGLLGASLVNATFLYVAFKFV